MTGSDGAISGGSPLPHPADDAAPQPQPVHSGHELPTLLSGGPATPPAPRRKHSGVLLGVLGGVAVAIALGSAQLATNLGYDAAEEGFQDALTTATSNQSALQDDLLGLEQVNSAATTIAASDSGTLLDAGSKEALVAAASSGESTAAEARDLLDDRLPAAGDKPVWFWELLGATQELERYGDAADEKSGELQDASRAAADEASAVHDAGLAALTSAASAAQPFEAAHPSARNLDVIALRDAAEEAEYASALDQTAVDAFTGLESAAAQVVASEQAELAEKAGPLQGTRLAVESFARSLAPGVLLDFDWAPLVNGFGYDGGMGGYTTWWYDDGGYSTIQLSNSVAEQWPSARSQALVAHEVGHAISVKCVGMYDTSTQDSIEKWATGWAIGMGYADDANGVWAYGYPPQSYIDAAAGCR